MVAIYNVVPGPAGGAPALILQNGGVPQQNGGQIGVQVFWIPGVAAPLPQHQAEWYRELVHDVYTVALNCLSTLKATINDVTASSDLLKLVININKFCEEKFPVRSLQIFAHAFKAATGINNPRSFFNRFYSVFSGEAATKEPLEHHYDWYRVASKMLFLISDVYSSIDWLHEIGYLTDECMKKIGSICICEYAINLSLLNTAATVTSSAINALDNFRLVLKYSAFRDDTLAGERSFKVITSCLDIVSDICRIASSILFACPAPEAKICGIGVSALGNLVALVKFYVDQYTLPGRLAERAQVEERKAAAMQLVQTELEIAARALHHATVSRQAIQLAEQVMHTLSERPGRIQLQTVHALAMATLANAIALAPAAPGRRRARGAAHPVQQLQRAWGNLQRPTLPVR